MFLETLNIAVVDVFSQTYSRKGDTSRGKQPRSYNKVFNGF